MYCGDIYGGIWFLVGFYRVGGIVREVDVLFSRGGSYMGKVLGIFWVGIFVLYVDSCVEFFIFVV